MQILTGVLVRLAVSHARNREFWPGVLSNLHMWQTFDK